MMDKDKIFVIIVKSFWNSNLIGFLFVIVGLVCIIVGNLVIYLFYDEKRDRFFIWSFER